ncbi:hypothetical protein [Kordia sp.]|uniref:hypothetical protein n=1 Tax=Kordia sp. TaxID=1965332 RepID=UPI003D288E11
MNLKKFITELVREWRLIENSKGLRATMGTPQIIRNNKDGLKGEKTALQNLARKYKDYEFRFTDFSKTPADIIDLKRTSKYWHFALFQVKTSKEMNRLTPEIQEKYTLPLLADVLKDVFRSSEQTNYYKKKQVYITIGYIGVLNSPNGNRVVKKCVYKGDKTMNKLNISYSDKVSIKNRLHT